MIRPLVRSSARPSDSLRGRGTRPSDSRPTECFTVNVTRLEVVASGSFDGGGRDVRLRLLRRRRPARPPDSKEPEATMRRRSKEPEATRPTPRDESSPAEEPEATIA